MTQPDLIMDVFDANQGNQADTKTKGSNKTDNEKDLFYFNG